MSHETKRTTYDTQQSSNHEQHNYGGDDRISTQRTGTNLLKQKIKMACRTMNIPFRFVQEHWSACQADEFQYTEMPSTQWHGIETMESYMIPTGMNRNALQV